jgi:3,4-dihydroxy 2-butanone 4-phosphate synthase/GTP cyclohydrolase II
MASTRPFITLTYAQSIDGSIAAQLGTPLALSSPESLKMTHRLRASHDAILVGIGTILADNPQLNVRYVPGPNPRPIILDSTLRCPPNARCLGVARRPIIATTEQAPMARQHELEAIGASILQLPTNAQNQIDLHTLASRLYLEGIRTLMVEGGASLITSFLQAQLVDKLIVTIAPMMIGGVRAVNQPLARLPHLRNASMEPCGDDWIISGEIDWS